LKITEKGIVPKRKFNKGEAWDAYTTQRSGLGELIRTSKAQITTSYDDFTAVGGNVKFLIACEGADFLEGNIERIDEVYLDGVRSIQLVHYTPNDIGDIQTSDPVNQGLSSYGEQIVKRMNKLGMVIDVAHASFKTVQNVAEISNSPIMLSHSILENGSVGPVSNRAIAVDHAKIISQTGGVIGVWPSGFSSDINDFVENTLRLIETVGVDHVGLGTDMDSNYKPVIKNYLEVQNWTNALSEKGLTDEEIGKLVSGNAHRVLKQVLK
jgi:membrane dipeptidase